MCSCTHLTSFTLSDLNPQKLFKDIINLFKQGRFINSFAPFKYLTWKNATVLYVICSILLVYFILLFFMIRRDLKCEDDWFVSVIRKEPNSNKKEDVVEELDELDEKIKQALGEKKENSSKNNSISSTNDMNIDTSQTKQKRKEKLSNEELINEEVNKKRTICIVIKGYFYLFKEFFKDDFWFCTLFVSSQSEIQKRIFLLYSLSNLININNRIYFHRMF